MSTSTPTWHSGWSQPDSGPDPFQVVVTRPATGLTIVQVSGGLDISTCPELEVHLDEELHDPARQVRDVIVDLTRLELLSVAGVRCLLRAATTARAEAVRLQLVIDPAAPAVRVLALLEVDGQLCVQPDLATARRAIA